jgi:hypothetical protein
MNTQVSIERAELRDVDEIARCESVVFVAPQARRCGAAAALLRWTMQPGRAPASSCCRLVSRICRRNCCMSARGGSAIMTSTSTSST